MEEAITKYLKIEEVIANTLENGGGYSQHFWKWWRPLQTLWKIEEAIANT
jgi:hypothetical protein